MIKSLTLSNGSILMLEIADDFSLIKKNTDEYLASFSFVYDELQIELANDTINYLAKSLAFALLHINEMNLPKPIVESSKDIGYWYNEYLHAVDEDLDLDFLGKSECENWIGAKYSVFESKNNTTWLYKNQTKYYLLITPIFYHHFSDGMGNMKNKLYSEFISQYHSILEQELTVNDIKILSEFILCFL